MLEMIHARRSSEKEDRHDLFSSLLDASEQEGENLAPGAVKLQDSELIGLFSSSFFRLFTKIILVCRKYFIFLLAGQEVKQCPLLVLAESEIVLMPDKKCHYWRIRWHRISYQIR
jgi:hypothetical protein